MSGYLSRLSGDVRRDAPEPARGFGDALRAGSDIAVIAEIKRSSPSEGRIAPDADVSATARLYADGGAAAMSVLVAERDFGGCLADLCQARAAAGLPALAKEFTVFPEQVAAQRTAGADAILVLLALVSDAEAARLLQTAELLGMDALVEAHTAEEVERALALDAAIVGVNARDLESLEVDRDRQLELLATLPRSVTCVAESGIATRADVEAAREAGADAVLVGTSLMRRPELLAELTGVPR